LENLNAAEWSHRYQHCQSCGEEVVHAVLQWWADGADGHGTYASGYLSSHGKSVVMKNKTYQPTTNDVNLYSKILDSNMDGRVTIDDF